jgi:hypothetical protein
MSLAQYKKSLRDSLTELDLFCDDVLVDKLISFIIEENINVLTDLMHSESNFNSILINKINFLESVKQ